MSLPTTIIDYIKNKIYDSNVKYLRETAINGETAYSVSDVLKVSATEKIKNFIAKTGGTQVPASKSLYDGLLGLINAVNRRAGNPQTATTTIDLNQAAATYDLFTGTSQNVKVDSLIIRMPDLAAGGALTSITIQTDDTTNIEFIDTATGAVANLTAEAQLASDTPILIATGQKIQLTIAGGAHGVAYVCTVVAEYKATVDGGYLT